MDDFILSITTRFPYMPQHKIEEVLALGEMLALSEGDIFIKAGEPARRAGLVLMGMMRNYVINHKGEEVTVLFASPMQPITPYATLLSGLPATETSAALEQTLLFVMDFELFKQTALTDPILTRLYLDMIESSLIAAVQRIEDFAQRNPEQRYLRLLASQPQLTDRIPLKFLASYIGITPVSLSRIRKRLSNPRN